MPCQEDDALLPGARMVWQRENTVTNHNQPRNILEIIYSQDKRVEVDVKPVGRGGSRNKIENIDELLDRVNGKLLPHIHQDEHIRLGKHIPAKARVVEKFRVQPDVRESYLPRGSVLVS